MTLLGYQAATYFLFRNLPDFTLITQTCGKFASNCLCRLSRSFCRSWNFASISLNFSWFSLMVSRSLSLSSSIDTISCSKLPSSPLNWEPRWDMLSSAIVGITSHIIFHILEVFFIYFYLKKVIFSYLTLTIIPALALLLAAASASSQLRVNSCRFISNCQGLDLMSIKLHHWDEH